MLRAGQLNSRLALERKTLTANAEEEQSALWAPWRTVWARIEQLDGRRRYVGARLKTEVTTRITIRFARGLDAVTVRGSCDGQYYDFESVIDPDMAHRELRIDAVARS